jgi:hypothetical protein
MDALFNEFFEQWKKGREYWGTDEINAMHAMFNFMREKIKGRFPDIQIDDLVMHDECRCCPLCIICQRANIKLNENLCIDARTNLL